MGLRGAVLSALAALEVSGCAPWHRFPMPVAPDSSCFEDGVQGWQFYVWTCVEGQHVVVGQYSSEMSWCLGPWAPAPVKQTAACGQQTSIEATETRGGRCVLHPGSNWGR